MGNIADRAKHPCAQVEPKRFPPPKKSHGQATANVRSAVVTEVLITVLATPMVQMLGKSKRLIEGVARRYGWLLAGTVQPSGLCDYSPLWSASVPTVSPRDT